MKVPGLNTSLPGIKTPAFGGVNTNLPGINTTSLEKNLSGVGGIGTPKVGGSPSLGGTQEQTPDQASTLDH